MAAVVVATAVVMVVVAAVAVADTVVAQASAKVADPAEKGRTLCSPLFHPLPETAAYNRPSRINPTTTCPESHTADPKEPACIGPIVSSLRTIVLPETS